MYSGYVGKRDVNAALRRLQAGAKRPGARRRNPYQPEMIDLRDKEGYSYGVVASHVTETGIASHAGPMALIAGVWTPLHGHHDPGAGLTRHVKLAAATLARMGRARVVLRNGARKAKRSSASFRLRGFDDAGKVEWTSSFKEFAESNAESPDVVAQARALRPGESAWFDHGGGATRVQRLPVRRKAAKRSR